MKSTFQNFLFNLVSGLFLWYKVCIVTDALEELTVKSTPNSTEYVGICKCTLKTKEKG